jgi:hypothetical protein
MLIPLEDVDRNKVPRADAGSELLEVLPGCVTAGMDLLKAGALAPFPLPT